MNCKFQKNEKRGSRLEIESRGYNLAGFDHFKKELLAELKKVKDHDLEGLVYWMELTYDKILDVIDIKHTSATSIGYTIASGKNEISDRNMMVKSLPTSGVKVKITIDDLRLKSNLTTKKKQ